MPPESALIRELRGPMADWDITALLLRNVEFGIRGLQWQNAGKGQRPKPIPLPDARGRGESPATSKPAGMELAQRLRNIGMIPADAAD